MRVSLFIPCFVDQLYPHIGIRLVELLESLGHSVDYPTGQTCCGQPAFNAGYHDEARSVAAKVVDVFRDAEVVVTPSGSCAAMVKVFFKELFEGTARASAAAALAERTWEAASFLVDNLGVTDVGARFPHRVTYHDGCHGLRELGIRSAPRVLLSHVRDLELVEMSERDTCCGFGGTFSVKFPQISTSMAEIKCGSIEETGANIVVSGDPSCMMQLQGHFDRQGRPIRCMHLLEVLAQR
ncbi:MAG: Fe-S oxidoreductase [Planctomycetota bacterium]